MVSVVPRGVSGRVQDLSWWSDAAGAPRAAARCALVQVPLTQSLYVPGTVVEADKMLVDVGTGYYVEKDQKKTTEFLERKVGGRMLCIYAYLSSVFNGSIACLTAFSIDL